MADVVTADPRGMAGAGRMTGAELQVVREWLGLTIEALAGMLQVNPRTVRSWEAGRDPIPERIRTEVEQIEQLTAQAVGELVEALRNARDPAVLVHRSDEEFHTAHPGRAYLPARWWRHVVARAVHEVPGVEILGRPRPTTTYTTRDEAIQREIVAPIEAAGPDVASVDEFDIEAIAAEVLGTDENGHYHVVIDPGEFWRVVERHAGEEKHHAS